MPDINITIGTPVLVAGKTFKVRYRLLPLGGWSSYQTKTNATFTLAGLADGQYELEAILVNADSSECPPTYKKFKVVTPFDCITFTAGIVKTGSLYYLEIDYAAPSGNPPCGWTVVYGGNVVNYPTLPTPPLKIQVPNQGIHLQVIANNCQLNQRACFDGDVPALPPPPCVPISPGSATANLVFINTAGQYVYNITIPFTQSVPCTNWFTLTCIQKNMVPGGIPAQVQYPNFTFGQVACSATSLTFQIAANPQVQMTYTPGGALLKKFEFDILLVDGCGKPFTFVAEAVHD